MKYTNNLNLPGPLATALQADDYTLAGGDISITGLIKPPRIRQLELRHDKEIVVDVSTRIWLLLGKAVHYVLEKSGFDNAFIEETFVYKIGGYKVKGQSDVFNFDGVLWDYKVSSAFSFKEAKPEWVAQLNCYAYFWSLASFTVNALRVAGIVRDWRWSEWIRDKGNYPAAAVVVVDLPLWSNEETKAYLEERATLHKAAEELPDDELPLCSDAERWAKPEAWAVKKVGGKAAIRGGVFVGGLGDDAEGKAVAMAAMRERDPKNLVKRGQDKGLPKESYYVEHRPGEQIRCARYCNAAAFCNQWAALKPPEPKPE